MVQDEFGHDSFFRDEDDDIAEAAEHLKTSCLALGYLHSEHLGPRASFAMY